MAARLPEGARPSPTGAPVSTSGLPGRGPFEAEDLLLGLWNLVALPIGALVAGSWEGREPAPLLGLIEVAAVIGGVVALATRPPGPVAPRSEFRTWILSGPLIGAFGLVGENGASRLGLPGTDVLLALAVLAGMGAIVFADRLPILDPAIRRLLVVPLILIATSFFQSIATDLVDGLDPGTLLAALMSGTAAPEALALGALIAGFVVAGSAVFFAMLVVAPRELADPEPRPGIWLGRFALFLVSAATGVGIWSLI
jgi:hypothetical protein